MTYKAIRNFQIYSEAQGVFSSLLKILVTNLDGTIETLVVDESEEPVVSDLINRLDGTLKADGSNTLNLAQIFSYFLHRAFYFQSDTL